RSQQQHRQRGTGRWPNVSMYLCAKAQLKPLGARSVKGEALFQRDVVAPRADLRVLVVGGVHGDELSSTSLVLHWIQAASQAPANIHWRFVPTLNPDCMFLGQIGREHV